MTWPTGFYQPSASWWHLGESGRRPIYDAIARLGVKVADVMSVEFGKGQANFVLIHHDQEGIAHLEGHCEGQAVVLHAMADGSMVCSCGRAIGQAHGICTESRVVLYPL